MKTLISIASYVIALFLLNGSVAFSAERAKSALGSAATQPFTYANVVSSFKEAHLRTTEVQPRCTIFFEGKWRNANIYDYCVIMGGKLRPRASRSRFILTDAREMN